MKPSIIEQTLETRYGDLHQVIPVLASEHGQEEAARQLSGDGLRVRQAWVSRWLRANGYEQVTRYVRTKSGAA